MTTETLQEVDVELRNRYMGWRKRIKKQLSNMAKTITESKAKFKDGQRNGNIDWEDYYTAESAKINFRHLHIAYCEFRGKTREQIERPAEGNEPREDTIRELVQSFTMEVYK